MAKSNSKKNKSPVKKILGKIPVMPSKIESKKPTVSVILSSYNHAAYISAAIQSVLNQTFTDFELLIYDDGSTDNTHDIIKSFEDPRIKTFLYTENRGPRLASQEAFAAAQGKYIAIHHSDDTWSADKYVVLTDNIDFSMKEFVPVPIFCGVFDGQGYVLNRAACTQERSYIGIFSKTSPAAVIRDLNVIGIMKPDGSPFNVGGIVGDNYGMVAGCCRWQYGYQGGKNGTDRYQGRGIVHKPYQYGERGREQKINIPDIQSRRYRRYRRQQHGRDIIVRERFHRRI